MANIAKTYTLVNGQPADATQVNKNFDDIIAGVGDISAAGHALIDDASADAQLTTLGVTAAGKALLDDANATAQIATLGAVATGDSRLSDARVASDVSAWAKAGTKPAYTAAEVGVKAIATGVAQSLGGAAIDVTHGLGVIPSYVGITSNMTTDSPPITGRTTTTFTIASCGAQFFFWIAVA